MKYLMLGKTVPEPTSMFTHNEYRTHYVCSAGLELDDDFQSMGLVRLFPLGLSATPKRWSVSRVDVERHKRDNRQETWKPTGSFEYLGKLDKSDKAKAIEPYLISSIEEANKRKLSLAMIKLGYVPDFILEDTKLDYEPTYELFNYAGHAQKARERFAYIPRLIFETASSWSEYKMQIRDWGIWELMRKNHEKLSNMSHDERVNWVGNSLHLKKDTYLFVGNFANHRNSWMIISILNL